jgi:F-type H+-transporting ATPase subunit epsilon
MAMTIHLDIVSAERSIFSGAATMVFAPAEMGEVGIAPRHAPLLTRMKPGQVRVQAQSGDERVFYVSGGILEVQPHTVTVLADTAERAADLDEAQALEAKRRAEQVLSDRRGEIDYATAEAQLAQAIAQLQIIRRQQRQRQIT